MDDIAESPNRAHSKPAVLLNYLTGCLKLLIILSPAWLLAFWLLAGTGNCRGDCAAGVAMLVIFFTAAFIGPALFLIGLPIVLLLLIWWTHGRPAQLLGGLTFIPLLLTAWWGFSYVRDTVVSSKMEAGIRPEYLSRTIPNPVGRLEILAVPGEGENCNDKCYEILINGMSTKYSSGYTNQSTKELFEKAFTLSTGEDCLSKAYSTEGSIERLQSQGIFGTCILNVPADLPTTAVALRGVNYEANSLVRPYGLQNVQVLQAVTNGTLGQELVRWEYGSLPRPKKPIGTPFQWEDLVRAYTGIGTDRFADARRLNHSQRIDAILRSEENPPLQLYAVFSYLRAAPNAYRYSGSEDKRQKLADGDIVKLKAIGKRICAATPMVKGFNSKLVDCIKAYNDLVRNGYPGNADALMLAKG